MENVYFLPFLILKLYTHTHTFVLLLATLQACSCDVDMVYVIVCCRRLASLNAIASFDIKTQASLCNYALTACCHTLCRLSISDAEFSAHNSAFSIDPTTQSEKLLHSNWLFKLRSGVCPLKFLTMSSKQGEMEFTEVVEESFKASARIGRRNAVSDIDKADPNAKIAALVQELQNLLPFNDYSTSQGAADHCNHCVAVDQT
ncbi:hypothetical protein T02_16383 [Trichinella nativa]|uniref:Uncharacterized protein n=1 Tax=Trichinella nativa TaxID=6335 RepID=A0A0V1L393_9BILA|nr:hypothetical protein T02_16383 [Trichinella nativa]